MTLKSVESANGSMDSWRVSISYQAKAMGSGYVFTWDHSGFSSVQDEAPDRVEPRAGDGSSCCGASGKLLL